MGKSRSEQEIFKKKKREGNFHFVSSGLVCSLSMTEGVSLEHIGVNRWRWLQSVFLTLQSRTSQGSGLLTKEQMGYAQIECMESQGQQGMYC